MRLSSMASRAGRLASISATARSHNGFLLVLCAALLTAPATRTLAQQIPDIIVFVTDDEPQHEQDAMPLVNSLLGPPFGVDFREAVAHAAVCDPSRATLFSGLYVPRHGVVSNESEQLFDWSRAFPHWLQAVGYRTVLIGKDFQKSPWKAPVPGWTVFKNRIGGKASMAADADRAAAALAEIQRTPASKPLLLYIGWTRPHYPSLPAPQDVGAFAGARWHPPSFNEADVSDKPAWIRALPSLDAAARDSMDAIYERQLEALQQLDRYERDILTELAARGTLAGALIIHVSDQGFELGEHRWQRDKDCPYEGCVRIPMLVRAPDVDARVDFSAHVSLVDLAPTIADYAGVAPPAGLDGRSLRPLLRDGSVVWPLVS